MNLTFADSSPSNRLEDRISEHRALDQLSREVQEALISVQSHLPHSVVDTLHGEWLGHPLHPALVHLPLGGWMIAGVLDFAPLGGSAEDRQHREKAADAALLLGTVGGLGAIATGWTEWTSARGQARRTGLIHGALNETAFFLNVGSLLARRRGQRKLGKALSGAGLGLALAGGLLGGQLVYRHRMG
ncbi:hypothetical protein GCM10017783_04390 [Deinococcus piscis]|uniref:DUF2231 domain-containing protein n=1 Tax=Deinococcus piscis TaxID=394230 RepID=A0ABQ3JZR3_9DEIO|nr:DUF2231 domain-containing protein [Deinococcus piscis]GHF95610.1 hypothetical protein GCM10017783_04390 [Deinococcus piscis]